MPGKGQGDQLTATQAAFCLEYEANGRNATRAYMATHPKAMPSSAAVNGWKMLRIAKVASALDRLRALRAKHLTMSAEEAAMLVGISARADIRLIYDADGHQLPPHQWPDEFAKAVKSIKADGTIVLHDQLKAREVVLLMHGKLKQVVDVNHFDHVRYLAEKNHEHKGARDAEATPGEAAHPATHARLPRGTSRTPHQGGQHASKEQGRCS